MKTIAVFVLVVLLLVVGTFFIKSREADAPETPPITYTPESARDMIRVTSPRSGADISSPLTITGEARGGWYFEATFPIVVVDWDGRIIGEGYATAGGEWMTEDFVPFSGTVTFTSDTTVSNRGAVILQRSNASGLPEHDAAVDIPIFFK